jgi:hypothetical protein
MRQFWNPTGEKVHGRQRRRSTLPWRASSVHAVSHPRAAGQPVRRDAIVVAFPSAIGAGSSDGGRRREPRGTARYWCSAIRRRSATSSRTLIAARRSTCYPCQGGGTVSVVPVPPRPSMSRDVQRARGVAYRRDISHSCRSPASAARCSGSIVPAVLSAPNTGLRQPHEQTACTPPSPTSWMVVW